MGLREGFLHNKHPRFRAQFANLGHRKPFFSKAQWTSAIETADLEKLGDFNQGCWYFASN